jgi:hypothetical protein
MLKKVLSLFFIVHFSLLSVHCQTWLTLTRPATLDTIKLEATKHGYAAKQIGDKINLNLQELGIVGVYTVSKIDVTNHADSVYVALGLSESLEFSESPKAKELRAITGRFKRYAPEIWDYIFSNSTEPIGSTPNHPFYSIDRKVYIPIGEITIGEHLQTYEAFALQWSF